MKKALLLASGLVLAACGSNADNANESTEDATTETETTTEQATTEEATTEQATTEAPTEEATEETTTEEATTEQAEAATAREFTEQEKTAMVDEFLQWADKRAKTAKLAVTKRYFDHGAAGQGDWFAVTPDGLIQAQDEGNPGFKGFKTHAIGGVAFYEPLSGKYGINNEVDSGSTAGAYRPFVVRESDVHKYLLADNGKVYELIKPAMATSFSEGFEIMDDNGKDRGKRPESSFVVSNDQDAQAEWKRILAEYQK